MFVLITCAAFHNLSQFPHCNNTVISSRLQNVLYENITSFYCRTGPNGKTSTIAHVFNLNLCYIYPMCVLCFHHSPCWKHSYNDVVVLLTRTSPNDLDYLDPANHTQTNTSKTHVRPYKIIINPTTSTCNSKIYFPNSNRLLNLRTIQMS